MCYYEKVVRVYCRDIENIDPKKTATFEKPTIQGFFSIDKERQYVDDGSNIMYYYPRFKQSRLELDLNQGMEKVVRKPEGLTEHLNHMLNYLMHHATKFLDETNSERLFNTDFLCYRGLLTQVMCSVHLREDWIIYATKWRGNIYLCKGDEQKVMNIPKTEQDKFCSWGYKFEQYMLTKKPGTAPDTSVPVYEPEEFNCVYQSKLNSHSLLYVAEVDGLSSNTEIDVKSTNLDKYDFIELKTSKKVHRISEDRTLKMFKYIKWWCQSYLVSVKEIHVGFRDHKGIIREIIPFLVKDLPRMSDHLWNWRTCLNFCDIFLNIVKSSIPEATNDPFSVWKFVWKSELQQFTVDEVKGPNPDSFVHKWFTDAMSSIPNL